MDWNGSVLRFDGAEFLVAIFREDKSTDDRFVVWKTRALLEATTKLIDRLQPMRIVELGIADGGSTAFLALYSKGSLLVAADLMDDPHPVLERFIQSRGLQDVVKTHYGVDQADRSSMSGVIAEFNAQPIDLVLDDASHRLEETRTSFNILFPLLRPGGVYAVEDWDWGHQDAAVAFAGNNDASGWWPGGTPLTRLAFEATIATSRPEIVASVEIDRHLLRITRGSGDLNPDTFDLLTVIGAAGRGLLPG